MNSQTRIAVAILAVATAPLLLTACVSTSPADAETEANPGAPTSELGDLSGALAEYRAATELYELPAGDSYPEPSFDDAAGLYEAGFGESEVVLFWNCAWGREYLELRGGDPAAAAAALEEFASLAETDAYARYFDPVSVHPVFEAAVEDARLGDPTTVQSIVEGSCAS